MFSRKKKTVETPEKPKLKERKFRFSIDDPDSFQRPSVWVADTVECGTPTEMIRAVQRGSIQMLQPSDLANALKQRQAFDDTDLELLPAPKNSFSGEHESR